MSQKNLQGEYSFRKMELVSAFNFTPDGKFHFYYSYGASDRSANGTYTIEGNVLKLKSNKEAGKDFNIEKQDKRVGNTRIKVVAENKMLTSGVLCVCQVGDTPHEFQSNQDGVIDTELKSCDNIFVQHSYFPDIYTQIKDKQNANNYFEISPQQSLVEVSFKGIDFVIQDNVLTCLPNYFLPFENIKFTKSE